MSRVASRLTMSKRVEELISQELNKRQLESHYCQRMQIIQKGCTIEKNKDIALDLSCTVDTVMLWRKRWRLSELTLLKLEEDFQKKIVTDKTGSSPKVVE